jgi:hypothetical protein
LAEFAGQYGQVPQLYIYSQRMAQEWTFCIRLPPMSRIAQTEKGLHRCKPLFYWGD